MRAAAWVLSVIGLACALVGFFTEGISIEFVGIVFGALGYYFGVRSGDRVVQILGAAAAILSVISIFVSAFEIPPQ